MRLSQIYFRSRRLPQNELQVPFKEAYPLKLKNYISGMTKKNSENRCLFEMMLVFACWQNTEFNNSKCRHLIEKFEACHSTFQKTMKEEKVNKKKEIPVPGSKNLSTKQLNYMLRQYPTV